MSIKKIIIIGIFGLLQSMIVNGQTIDQIIIPGATSTNNGTSWDVEFYSSTNTTTNKNNYKEIQVIQTGTKGSYLVWDASVKTNWEIVQGQPTSGSWFGFCKPMLENDVACQNKCTTSYYIRHIGTTTGQQTTSITLGLNSANNCAFTTGSPSFTISATVDKVAATGIYTWIEPASGLTDSSYKIAANWSPTRTTPSTDDILVVDLARTAALRNTTIDISNLTESINQFKIFPYNNVTFKCTANTAWTVGKATSTTGDDFIVEVNGGMRKSSTGILDIIIPAGNTAVINSKLAVGSNPSGSNSGTLLFSGAGSHSISGNVHVDGGTLSFKPSSTNTLIFNGTGQSVNGTGGELYIDSNMLVTIGTGSVNTFTLNRSFPLYSKLTLLQNTTVASNSPAADWNAWTPHLQFKWFDKVGSKAFGELGVMPSGAAITGGCLVEILNSSKRAYRTVGIPLKNAANLSQFVDDIHLTGTVTDGTNKDSFTTSCSWCKSSIFRWNENTASWTAYTSGASANKIDPGKGVLVFFRGARAADWGLGDTSVIANSQIIDFKGQVQTGDLTVSGLVKSNGGALDGANLIANPYPSTLNFRSFYQSNTANILPRYYTYDALAKNYNTWDSTTTGGTPVTPSKGGASWFQNASGDSRYINPGAAFFVFTRSNGGSVLFTESMKEASKRSKGKNFEAEELKETPCNEFRMTMNYTVDTAFESDGFTMQYDLTDPEISNDGEMFDAPKFYGGFLGIGTMTANNRWLAIDRRSKLADIGNTHTIPLKVAYPKTGPTDVFFTINSCSFGNGPYKIQLVDKVLNTVEEVGDNSIYQYTINTADEKKADRFELLFTAVAQQMNSKDIATKQNDYIVYPNPAIDGMFNIVNNQNNSISSIRVYNMQGQLVREINRCSSDLIPVTLENCSAGMYTVKIIGKNNIESHSVIVK